MARIIPAIMLGDGIGWPLRNWGLDVRYAIRRLRRSPGFTALAVLMLSAGIGITTSLFSLLNGTVLRQPELPDVDRLIGIARVWEGGRARRVAETVSYPDFAAVAAAISVGSTAES